MNETNNPGQEWKQAAIAARDDLAEAAARRIAEAEGYISAAARATTEGEALAALDRASAATAAADRIIDGGEALTGND